MEVKDIDVIQINKFFQCPEEPGTGADRLDRLKAWGDQFSSYHRVLNSDFLSY